MAIKNLSPGAFVQVGAFKNTDISIPSDLIMTKELTSKARSDLIRNFLGRQSIMTQRSMFNLFIPYFSYGGR